MKLNVPTESGMYNTNHLIFVDNLKLMAKSNEVLKMLIEETKEFFKAIELEMNKYKSTTNTEVCAEDAAFIEGIQSFKYLGIIETALNSLSKESFKKVRNEIIKRTKRLYEINLKSKNLFKGINEHVYIINYNIGILKLESKDFKSLDDDIRSL